MKSFKIFIDKLVNLLSVIFMSSLVFITFFQVINRYILKYPICWTEEIARFLLVWVTLIGAALCTREDSHIQIDLLYLKFNPKIQQIISLIINLIFLTFAIFIIYQGIAILQFIKFQKAESVQISMIWVYIAGPIGFLIIIFYLVLRIIKIINSFLR